MDAQVENLPFVSMRGLEGILVAPHEVSRRLPNHLTDTKTFSSVQEQRSVKTRPHVIHFNGYRVGQLHQQTLHIVNCSNDNVSMHIIPPTTEHFSIQYHKQRGRLVPGLSLDVTVMFRPTEWRCYYDCVRIHCKGEENLLIPIHAYPVMNTTSFPRKVSFPATPIGRTHTHTINLHCEQPVEFEFSLSFIQPHPAFTVSPMQGIVPANGKVAIVVTFAPVEFSTAIMKLQLEVSQFNSKPLMCTFTGHSTPGLAVDLYKKQQPRLLATKLPSTARQLAPLDRLREKRRRRKDGKGFVSDQNHSHPQPDQPQEVLFEGIRFPPNLDTPSAVAKVLAQEAGQLKANQLKQATSFEGRGRDGSSRQVKEAMFLQRVKEVADQEKAVKLKWVTHLGSLPMSMEEKQAVLRDREEAQSTYQRRCHVAVLEEEEARKVTTVCKRRTRRVAGKDVEGKPLFDLQANDLWRRRHKALNRFVQAGRKVMIRLRCEQRLKMLRKMVADLKGGKELSSLVTESKADESSSHTNKLTSSSFSLLPKALPQYSDTDQDKNLTSGSVPVDPTVVVVQHDPPLLSLRVPQHWKLMGYSVLPLPGCYVAPDLARPLRTGAKEELTGMTTIPGVDPRLLHLSNQEEIKVEDVEEEEEEEEKKKEVLPLVPPPSLLKPPTPQHRLSIFDPCPEMLARSYRPMLQSSEVTLEHNLLPLATPTSAPHPQPKLDRQDGIAGVMKWKQFHSQVLVSMDSQKKLSSFWKPRLSDPFMSHLLPSSSPSSSSPSLSHQLSGPQPDDFVDEQSEGLPVPTHEMLQAEFYIPDKQEPVNHREMSKRELATLQKSQFGELGGKISQKMDQLLFQPQPDHPT